MADYVINILSEWERYKDSSQQRLMREVQKGRDRMRTIPIE